jgi:hypothetical protein
MDAQSTPAVTREHFAASHSIGRRSRAVKTRHLIGRIWRVLVGGILVVIAAAALGLLLGGIGFGGLFFTALACVLVAALLLRYPRLRVPPRAELTRGSLSEVVANAELWLETRRSSLPAEAARQVDAIGVQLDGLGLQLDHASPPREAEAQVRRLVGEHLPAIVGRYTAAPRPASDEAALVDSLERIGAEIDRITRQLATGSLDDLELKARSMDFGPGELG